MGRQGLKELVTFFMYIQCLESNCTCFCFPVKAFSILDKDGSGVVTTDEMTQTYDVSQNPAVKSGKAACGMRFSIANLTEAVWSNLHGGGMKWTFKGPGACRPVGSSPQALISRSQSP